MRTYIALGITVVWALSYVTSVFTNNYVGFEVSTPVMMIAASYLLTSDILKRRNGGDKP